MMFRIDESNAMRNMRVNGYNPYNTARDFIVARCRVEMQWHGHTPRNERTAYEAIRNLIPKQAG